MILLLILISSGLCETFSDEQPEQLQNVYSYTSYLNFYNTSKDVETLSQDYKLQNVSIKVKRQAPADKMKQFLDHASIIARIANGISLQSGLMDGSTPIDTAVGELLNFGSVKISDIIQFKPENMNTLAEKLKGLPKTLDSSVKDLEDVTLSWNQIRSESEAIKNVLTLPGKTEYLKAVDEFSKEFKTDLLDTANTAFETVINLLSGISKQVVTDKTTDLELKTMFATYFFSLPLNLDSLGGKLTALSELTGTITKFKSLQESASVFLPIIEVIRLQALRSTLKLQSDAKTIEIFENNLKKILEISPISKSILADVQILVDLTLFRTHFNKNPKTYTLGFFDGFHEMKNLAKDVQDKWIDSISDGKISLINLSDGLQPVLKFKDRLAEVDRKLEPLSKSKGHEGLRALLKDMSEVNQDDLNAFSVLKQFDECHNKAGAVFNSINSEKVIGAATEIGKLLIGVSRTIENLDIAKLESDIANFKKLMAFSDMTNIDLSTPQVPDVLKMLKENDNLANFKKNLENIKANINVDKKTLDANVKLLTTDGDKVNDFTGLDKEMEMYKCLWETRQDSEKVALAARIIQKLRILDFASIQDAQNSMSIISAISKDLENLKSTSETMKKEEKPVVTDLNGLKNSQQVSSTLGISVHSLRGAYGLKQLEAEISELKTSTVEKEAENLKDPVKQQNIRSAWGDNPKDIVTLETGIRQIETFSKNLNEPKTMSDYGRPFLELLKIFDIKIDTHKKIQALDVLIPLVQEPTEFEKNKKTLEKIDSLDLSFAQHKAQLETVSQTFEDFYNFLVEFSSASSKRQNEKKEEKDNLLTIILVACGSSLLAVAIVIGIIFLIYKYRNRVNKKSLIKWIRAQYFEKDDYAAAYRYHEACLKAMEVHAGRPDKDASLAYLPAGKHRDPDDRFCKVDTALHHIMKDGRKMPIHANLIESPNGVKFYATQAPIGLQPGWKPAKPDGVVYEDTREDFWHMCAHDNVEFIVMLCNVETFGGENRLYFPTKKNEVLKFGRYEVKLVEIFDLADFKDVEAKRFEVKDTSGNFRRRIITHFTYNGWPDMRCPKEGAWSQAYEIMKLVQKSKRPIVVHCMSGIGRTMSFIGLHTVSEGVKKNPEVTMSDELSKLRARRYDSIQCIRQSYWLQVAVAHKLNEDYKLGLDEELKKMFDTFYQVACKEQGPKEFMEKRQMMRQSKQGVVPKSNALGAEVYY